MNDLQPQPFLTSTRNGRQFVGSAVAVQAYIFDEQGRILLLHSPRRNPPNQWQVVSGGLEPAETVLEGVLREVSEEAGPDVCVKPLGTIHAQTFHYDAGVPYMIGIYYLLAYEGGEPQPGDDMADAIIRWWSPEEMEQEGITFHASTHPWMIKRGWQLYQLWKDETPLLQPCI